MTAAAMNVNNTTLSASVCSEGYTVDSTSILPYENNVQMVFCHRFSCVYVFLSHIFNCSVLTLEHINLFQNIFFPLHTYINKYLWNNVGYFMILYDITTCRLCFSFCLNRVAFSILPYGFQKLCSFYRHKYVTYAVWMPHGGHIHPISNYVLKRLFKNNGLSMEYKNISLRLWLICFMVIEQSKGRINHDYCIWIYELQFK